MVTLALELSNPSSGPSASEVGLGDVGEAGVEVLAVEAVAPGSRERDDLLPACERLMRRAGRSVRDIEAIAVDVGPGGFTGLRVAVTAAATLSETIGARLIAVPATRVAAVAAGDEGPVVVALASKRSSAFVEAFIPGAEPGEGGQLLEAKELEDFAAGLGLGPAARMIADDYLPEAFGRACGVLGWVIEPMALSAASLLAAAAAGRGWEVEDAAALKPIYGREPEAVTLWRARRGP